jgi:prolyl oligopeptidase
MESWRSVFWLAVLVAWVVAVMPVQAGEEESSSASRELHKLFEEEWEYTLREDRTFASYLGDRRYNDRWPDVSLAAIERRHEHDKEVLHKLDAIAYEALPEADKTNYTLFRKEYENNVEGHPFRSYLLPLSHQGGIQTANELADALRFASVKDYEDWIARLRSFPTLMGQTIDLLREGIRVGVVHPRVIMERVPDQIAAQIVDDPAQSLFFKAFQRFPDDIGTAERTRLSAEAKHAIAESVVSSFRQLQAFFNGEYLPACLERVGVWQVPRGKEFYAYRARVYTTTDLTPEEIHQIGQQEVRRIRAQMEEIIQRVKFEGSFEEFLHFLRTDPQFYYKDGQELLQAYRALAKRIDPTLVKLFKTLPRMPYGIEPIPDHIAPDTTTAYYRQPAADGSRAGTYFVNLYRPEVRPKYEMEALSIHEAVPGHHLQIAVAMELGELPAFRRYGGYTAFTEGWGLYSESLGEELGFYQDPYAKFGQLTYEMWRAVRLVVDTGMHSMGWTRQQAIDFFKANAAKTEADIINEIDRYIAWPGQALAYKIGELKIKELRARARGELGERFDVREFHDVVLGSGAVTLDILEANVNAWIAREKEP